MFVVGAPSDKAFLQTLERINQEKALGLQLQWRTSEQLSQKSLLHFAATEPVFVAILKNVPTLVYYDGSALIKLSPNWQSLAGRIVRAGRKSELLLQACKITQEMKVVDATAGFGHDGLILASTGARATLIEQNPIMALLLFYEHQSMKAHKNWQKLLGRVHIIFGSALEWLPRLSRVDLVYLDPMFPQNSHQAKVGKRMQILHHLLCPPSLNQERALLDAAKLSVDERAKVVVKRPVGAEYLARRQPVQSYANAALRFDVY